MALFLSSNEFIVWFITSYGKLKTKVSVVSE